MFKRKQERAVELEGKIKSLKRDRTRLKEEVEDLKLEKKISDEDIKHMVKMKEEKLSLDFKKKEMDIEQEKQVAIAEVKDQYRDKVEKTLETQKNDIKEMYQQILGRLPDINVKLKGDVYSGN